MLGQAPRKRPTQDATTVYDRVLPIISILALVLIAIVVGGTLTAARVFPGNMIAMAYEGGKSWYSRSTGYDDVLRTDLWHPARFEARGVTINEAGKGQPGPTLFTTGGGAVARLIDARGTVLHEWRRPFSTVWTDDWSVKDPQPDSHVYFRKARMMDDGDLLAIYEGVGDTPYGYGMVRLDAGSGVVWSYPERTHHSFDVAADESVYVLTHEISLEELPEEFSRLRPPRIEDFLVVLSADGKERRKLNLTRLIARSRYSMLLHTVAAYSIGDPLHSNDVDLITEAEAARLPFAEAGQVLLSFRELNALAVVDVEREDIVWATRGPWLGQHDPDITDDGTILLFDNNGRLDKAGGRSRVIEFDPETMEIVWRFQGTPQQPFSSPIRASQQRLANGNTLVTESSGGRLLEVAQNGEVVWQYVNEERHGSRRSFISVICWAQRVAENDFVRKLYARQEDRGANREEKPT